MVGLISLSYFSLFLLSPGSIPNLPFSLFLSGPDLVLLARPDFHLKKLLKTRLFYSKSTRGFSDS